MTHDFTNGLKKMLTLVDVDENLRTAASSDLALSRNRQMEEVLQVVWKMIQVYTSIDGQNKTTNCSFGCHWITHNFFPQQEQRGILKTDSVFARKLTEEEAYVNYPEESIHLLGFVSPICRTGGQENNQECKRHQRSRSHKALIGRVKENY